MMTTMTMAKKLKIQISNLTTMRNQHRYSGINAVLSELSDIEETLAKMAADTETQHKKVVRQTTGHHYMRPGAKLNPETLPRAFYTYYNEVAAKRMSPADAADKIGCSYNCWNNWCHVIRNGMDGSMNGRL